MLESEIKPIWWLPTIGFFLFLAIEFSVFFAGPSKLFEDPGVGRHLRTAEFILETGQIPRADPLSYTHGGEPWFDFEWAFEATIGELYRAGGLGLVCGFCYAAFAVTILGVYRTLLQAGFSSRVVLLYTALAYLTLHLHFAVRPVLFTYLFMALVVEAWSRNPQPRPREWIILPVVFAFWANIHAGWLAALVFLVLSLFGRWLDIIYHRVEAKDAPLKSWIGLTLLCAAATLINPWGWALHHHVVLLATTYKSFALWDEYLPPNFITLSMSALTILFILITDVLARVLRRAPPWRWELAWPVLFFLYEGLKAQRHVLLLVEVALIPVARDLEGLLVLPWPDYLRARLPFLSELVDFLAGRLKEFQARQRAAGADAWLALIAAVGCAWLFMRTPMERHIQVGASVTPQLVSFLHNHPDRFQRPLNTTWNAGPLLWNMRPDFRVSFDDRGDFYGDDTVFAFVNMVNGTTSKTSSYWRDTFEKGNYDSALLDPYLKLNKLILTLPGWKEVYRDDHVVVYWKDAE